MIKLLIISVHSTALLKCHVVLSMSGFSGPCFAAIVDTIHVEH